MTAQALQALPARPALAGACPHCGAPSAAGEFCCTGCSTAYALIRGLGLEQYYQLRSNAAPVAADADADVDWSEFVTPLPDGRSRLSVLVGDMQCAACLWLIEHALRAQPGMTSAQLSSATRRLTMEWTGPAADASRFVQIVTRLGYRCLPVDESTVQADGVAGERELLRAMAVAGFAAANIMLLSVSVWSGHGDGMGVYTRDLFHGISALIAIPAIAYAGRPFFRSAFNALRHGRTNMDVPISIGVTLAVVVSMAEVMRSGPHAYFDAAITLLFFLLVGRFLDLRARGFARRTAQQLLAWTNRPVAVLTAAGVIQRPASRVAAGERILVAAGERIGVDGLVQEGVSSVDASLLTGEILPQSVAPGAMVYAGATNLEAPLTVQATAVGAGTLVGEMTRLLESAEQSRSRFVRLAEQVARWYAPVVHVTALLSFAGWMLLGDADWRSAVLIAAAVLIITCPCALALAVPAVQVVASSRLMRSGILVKSATALERASAIDTVIFDKTGTLTIGQPRLVPPDATGQVLLPVVAAMAARSRHPLCRALVAACPDAVPADHVQEHPGQGLSMAGADGEYRLGNAGFAGVPVSARDGCSELWFARPGQLPYRFRFRDSLRSDAAAVIGQLRDQGRRLVILSGDHADAVAEVATALGIDDWRAGLTPKAKADFILALKDQGRRILMVGDGLNDAAALGFADASLSPATGMDITQNVADAVFQGEKLGAVPEFLGVAEQSQRLCRQNIGFSLVYNMFAVPLAIAGMVTPLIAAVAMSSSSLVVVANAVRLGLSARKARP
ncbi:MAG: heavy metal translocating P-type ATPase metal-binding domain-containing protein [Ferrovibrio sp.]|uniref:heavy metal translocating P-type ATPase metal-binding domain-containing protein n=1 Tax=Ferrovibrio sp. TaxID=1917215 RepID=UPI00262356D3|nr:heavy metal translocating P-type ATPase metal-binding domain-containing protein [Ferrovibrio sp.]MCW0233007.1 heavy metal translocating P-type ATPase metal-binding domain-containing protein [Ferrovibrio sp.]